MSDYPKPTARMVNRVVSYLIRGWPASKSEQAIAYSVARSALRFSFDGTLSNARISKAVHFINTEILNCSPRDEAHRIVLVRDLIQSEGMRKAA
jgi:hypothetical protein